jgi:hypothetical protein
MACCGPLSPIKELWLKIFALTLCGKTEVLPQTSLHQLLDDAPSGRAIALNYTNFSPKIFVEPVSFGMKQLMSTLRE